MFILGISCYYHDSAAVIIEDGMVIAAAEEERFSRLKHDKKFPRKSIQFCLSKAGIQANDLEYAVFYENPIWKLDRVFESCVKAFPKSIYMLKEALKIYAKDRLWIKQHVIKELNISEKKFLYTNHHISHAASAFLTSPFETAAIITVDGVGEWTTATQGIGVASWEKEHNNSIKIDETMRFPHSLGLLYSVFTAYLGFKVNSGEYKVMGMSSYGKPRYLEKVEKIARINKDGSISLDLDYFSFHYSLERPYNNKFIDLFGEPRKPESLFCTFSNDGNKDSGNCSEAAVAESQRFADIAASIQTFCEEAVLKMAKFIRNRSGLDKLAMAGGVALNCLSNRRLLEESGFKEIHIQPAAGDSGGALGAALYVYHVLLGKPRKFIQEHNFLGANYGDLRILHAIKRSNFSYERYDDFDVLVCRAVEAIKSGKVIGWFQDRFEWGPRALGNRSILADPRRKEMKKIVNEKIKFRELFRPFAPAVLSSHADEYFVESGLDKTSLSRFMLTVSSFKPNKMDKVPAVCHIDGTGRVQIIKDEWNPKFNKLIEYFGEATGVPVLLNTSFNLRSEPIVNNPEDALSTYLRSGLDILVMGNYIVYKSKQRYFGD